VGNLIKIGKTLPMPDGAKIGRNGTVTWLAKGKKKTGKMSSIPGRVSVQSDTWTAQFRDENGKTQRVSTKTTVKSVAEKMLVRYQTEVDRIRTGVATRDELSKAHFRLITLEKALEQFRTKMVASGNTVAHINTTAKFIKQICTETNIVSLSDIRRENVERWIANEVGKKAMSPCTINHYLTAIKTLSSIFRYNASVLRYYFCKDLEAAGIERVGSDGRSIDVHSLRKTFGTMLAKAGIPLTTVQRLMRHSTPLLTAKLYIDVDAVDMAEAVDKLPEF